MHPIERLRFVARASGQGSGLVREAATALAAFADDPAGRVIACRRIVERHPTDGRMWSLCARVLLASDAGAEAHAVVAELDADRTSEQLGRALPEGATIAAFGSAGVLWAALDGRADVQILLLTDPAVDAPPTRPGFEAFDDLFGGRIGRLSALTGGYDEELPDGEEGRLVDVSLRSLAAVVQAADLVLLQTSAGSAAGFVAPTGSLGVASVARQFQKPVWVAAEAGTMLPGRLWERIVAGSEELGTRWDRPAEVVPMGLVERVVGPRGAVSVEEAARRSDCPLAPELLR